MAQTEGDTFDIKAYILIDTAITITARRNLDLDDMIRQLRSDESLHKAFRNLRFETHDFETRFEMRKRNGEIKAQYYSLVRQHYDGNCRSMDLVVEESRGKFFKNKKKRNYKFFTAEMFDRLFYTHGKICGEKRGSGFNPDDDEGLSGKDKYVHELKKLIFSPGEATRLPFIGDKTAIFTEKMAPYYHYRLDQTADYYILTANARDDHRDSSGELVIRYLSTYFKKGSLQVTGRRYRLRYETLVYSFDIEMIIDLHQLENGDFVPSHITYEGYWNIPFKTIEIGSFHTRFYNFGL